MITVKVATVEKKIFEGEVSKLTIKSINGVFTVLPNHVPVVTLIKEGYIQAEEFDKIEIKKAFVTVSSDSVVNVLISQL